MTRGGLPDYGAAIRGCPANLPQPDSYVLWLTHSCSHDGCDRLERPFS